MESVESIISLFEPFFDQDATPVDDVYPMPSFPRIDVHLLNDLFNLSKETLKKNKALLEISSPMIVVGDLHGNLIDFLKILYYFGVPPKSRYLFLGDFVDRGRYSVNVISLILSLMVKYPNDIYLIRGNHEFSHINRAYGFFDECLNTYGSEQIWNQFQEVFSYLPLAAVIGGSVFCVHGGLSPLLKSLDSIRDLPLPIPNYFNNTMISDLVWSDPVDTVRGFQLNHRGSGQIFGPDVVENFLRYNKLKIMIRGHQCTLAGFKPFANFMGITVFSSSNYCSSICNKCGVVSIKDRDVSFYNIEESDMGLSPSATMCLPIDGDVGLKRIFRTISRPDFHKEISPTINSPLQEQDQNNDNEGDEEEEEEDEDEFNFQLRNPPTKPYTFQQTGQYQPSQQQYNSVMQMRVNMILNQQQQQINNSILQKNVPNIPSDIDKKEEQSQKEDQDEKANPEEESNENPVQVQQPDEKEEQNQPEEKQERPEQLSNEGNTDKIEQNSVEQQPEEEESNEKIEQPVQQTPQEEKSEQQQNDEKLQESSEEEKVEQNTEEQSEENKENLEQQQPLEENKEEEKQISETHQESKEKSEEPESQPNPEELSKQPEEEIEQQQQEQSHDKEEKEQKEQPEQNKEEEEKKEEENQQKQDQDDHQDHPQEDEKHTENEEQQEQQQSQVEEAQNEAKSSSEEEQKEQLPEQKGQEEQNFHQEQAESPSKQENEVGKEKVEQQQQKEPHTPKAKHVKLALPPIPKSPGSPSSISVTFGNEPRGSTHQNFLQRSQSVIDSLGGV
ncbi:hypothetical protein M9Y10_029023 [Tritrichomonas musculus]|uniref:Serine/threonine-protein phosphatase n=1 Tax=Tritrichomonas musculus TaxID=1915356 RepID=A0ABR2KKY0_9EUKA